MSSLAPRLVVGNLRLTDGGVYADYLLSGLPFIFLSEEWQNTVAAEHAELWRALPSGSSISGLTVPVPARGVARKMLHSHPALRAPSERPAAAAARWVRHCRSWEPAIAGAPPPPADLLAHRPAGLRARRAHRDRQLAQPDRHGAGPRQGHRLVAVALPRAGRGDGAARCRGCSSRNRPAWNRSGGTGTTPPAAACGPTRCPHSPTTRTPACPARRSPRCISMSPPRRCAAGAGARPAPRTRCSCAPTATRTDGVADSYQALIALDSFPDTGVAWPRSTIFKVLDDLTRPDTTLDWTINTTFTTADTAVSCTPHPRAGSHRP